MTGPTRDRLLVVAVLAVVVALVVGATLVPLSSGVPSPPTVSGDESRTLVVETAEEDRTVLSIPVELGDTVVLEYTHSVEKTPVRDVYTVSEEGLAMVRMEFQSYGAGLPSTADVETTENGTFVYEPPDTRPGPLFVSPGEVAGHDLVVDGTRYDLVERVDGESVVFTLETA